MLMNVQLVSVLVIIITTEVTKGHTAAQRSRDNDDDVAVDDDQSHYYQITVLCYSINFFAYSNFDLFLITTITVVHVVMVISHSHGKLYPAQKSNPITRIHVSHY